MTLSARDRSRGGGSKWFSIIAPPARTSTRPNQPYIPLHHSDPKSSPTGSDWSGTASMSDASSRSSGEEEHDDENGVPSLSHLASLGRPLISLSRTTSNWAVASCPHGLVGFFQRLNTFAGRRLVQLVLTLSLPLLLLLLVGEVRFQRTQAALWEAEAAARGLSPSRLTADARLNLGEWRWAWSRRHGFGGEVLHNAAGVEREHHWDERVGAVPSWIQTTASADVWPAWWGNSDEVGPSPFDYTPKPLGPGEQKKRILFLTSYEDYLERMNTHTYEIVDASIRHPNVITDVWGPGWMGYDWTVPLSVNIKRRANRVAALESAGSESQVPAWEVFEDSCNPDVAYDIVWTISDIYKREDLPHLDALDCGSLLVQQVGDCHEHRCMNEWYPHANNITVVKYAFELEEIFNYANVKEHYPEFHMGLFGHSPDTANEWDFYPTTWSNKTLRAAVFGFDGSFYPIRTTVTSYLNSLGDNTRKATVQRHPHPGYTVDTPAGLREHPLETYTTGAESYKTHRAIREDFARGMREAQICVFDSSLERKMIRKYAQALLSGCVLATDLPTEHEEALGRFTIPIEPGWNIKRIEKQLSKYLRDPARLHQMAMDGFAYARQHLTTTAKVAGVLRLADLHRAGYRGYDHSAPFSSRCRAYWSDEASPRPPWCRFSDGYRGLEDVRARK